MSDQPEAKTGRIAQIRQAYTRHPAASTPGSGGGCSLPRSRAAAVVIGIGALFGGFWVWYAVLMAIPRPCSRPSS